jgi:Ribbon-helix-helix protein, copG family
MKVKVSAYLSQDLAKRLEAAVNRHGSTKTAILEAALARYLNPDGETNDQVSLLRRLNWMSRQLEHLDRDLRIVNETVALHARYHLTVTPPMPASAQRAACRLGAERFEVLAAQVGRRVHLGMPLMRGTMDRLTVTSPGLFTHEREVVDADGAPGARDESASHDLKIVDTSAQVFAAAREDGSNGSFPSGGNALSLFTARRRYRS